MGQQENPEADNDSGFFMSISQDLRVVLAFTKKLLGRTGVLTGYLCLMLHEFGEKLASPGAEFSAFVNKPLSRGST